MQIWHLITTALVQFWHTEVVPQATAEPLAPIRFYGEVRDLYLA